VYTQGIRLENQQFGDEHGLGIDDAGIESVEVIKGPASLLYGSDALGGVLYLNPERFALAKTRGADLQLNYFSNTEGLSANAGYRSSGEHMKFLLRTGYTSHADYRTGSGNRVTNSRFQSYDLKTGLGYQAGNFKSEVRYNYNTSDLGLPEEIGIQTTNRTPDMPFQELDNHILSGTADLFMEKSSLKLTLGYVFNNRKEFEEEEGPDPALHMKLSTFNYNLQYQLPKTGKLETILGLQGMRQNNSNFGEEILIPDAKTNDIGLLGTSHLHFEKSDLQFGLRYDYRGITGEQNGIEGEEGFIQELDRNFNSFNLALGYRTDITKNIIGRVNLASGFRAPNLAELTSNGVHEGTNRFEIGNPGLENEKNLQTDVALEYKNEHFEFYLNGFYNNIRDYIFIEPNGEMVGEDPVYLYRQQDAKLYGGEFGLHIHPHPLDWLHLESSYQTVIGKTDDGAYLPLIPANSFRNTLRVEIDNKDKWLKRGYAYLSVQSVLRQNNITNFETPTAGYNLLNIGIGGNVDFFEKEMEIRISANNILDANYISHLSRLKTDGILNIGRNINVGISMPFL
ncbi:MAG: TonB-dependent receptor, partial [Eudoraea sp.]|nr:TonB-dependent receptor [Eudoraea sp.]